RIHFRETADLVEELLLLWDRHELRLFDKRLSFRTQHEVHKFDNGRARGTAREHIDRSRNLVRLVRHGGRRSLDAIDAHRFDPGVAFDVADAVITDGVRSGCYLFQDRLARYLRRRSPDNRFAVKNELQPSVVSTRSLVTRHDDDGALLTADILPIGDLA